MKESIGYTNSIQNALRTAVIGWRSGIRESFTFVLLVILSIELPAEIPPVPENQQFTSDYIVLFGADTLGEISKIQESAFNLHQTPIIVVTIQNLAQYGWTGSIEPFAQTWFNTWKIGTGKANKGILFLISVGDRQARIELGADWGRRWDGYCQYVMDNRIVPEFKEGNFGQGVLEGMASLGKMAELGPEAEIPEPGMIDQLTDAWKSDEKLSPLSPLPGKYVILLMAAGILCLILAIFLPQYRKTLVLLGIALIVIALVLWIIIAIIAVFTRGKGGVGGGSGGGFGGGFSGGGGATGSW